SAAGALTASGNASIGITGLVLVNSSSSSALTAGGNAHLTARTIQVKGGVSASRNAGFSTAPITAAASVSDPLAGLPVPDKDALGLNFQGSVNVSGSDARTIGPGVYAEIKVSGSGRLTLSPGIYVLAGGGLAVTGGGGISGDGVMFYNAGSNYLPGP